jgi:hypothetical protein
MLSLNAARTSKTTSGSKTSSDEHQRLENQCMKAQNAIIEQMNAADDLPKLRRESQQDSQKSLTYDGSVLVDDSNTVALIAEKAGVIAKFQSSMATIKDPSERQKHALEQSTRVLTELLLSWTRAGAPEEPVGPDDEPNIKQTKDYEKEPNEYERARKSNLSSSPTQEEYAPKADSTRNATRRPTPYSFQFAQSKGSQSSMPDSESLSNGSKAKDFASTKSKTSRRAYAEECQDAEGKIDPHIEEKPFDITCLLDPKNQPETFQGHVENIIKLMNGGKVPVQKPPVSNGITFDNRSRPKGHGSGDQSNPAFSYRNPSDVTGTASGGAQEPHWVEHRRMIFRTIKLIYSGGNEPLPQPTQVFKGFSPRSQRRLNILVPEDKYVEGFNSWTSTRDALGKIMNNQWSHASAPLTISYKHPWVDPDSLTINFSSGARVQMWDTGRERWKLPCAWKSVFRFKIDVDSDGSETWSFPNGSAANVRASGIVQEWKPQVDGEPGHAQRPPSTALDPFGSFVDRSDRLVHTSTIMYLTSPNPESIKTTVYNDGRGGAVAGSGDRGEKRRNKQYVDDRNPSRGNSSPRR